MNSARIRAYCRQCKHQQYFVRYAPNHLFHLALTILTAGLWVISWIAVSIGSWLRPWRCKHCGWHEPQFDDVAEQKPPTEGRHRSGGSLHAEGADYHR